MKIVSYDKAKQPRRLIANTNNLNTIKNVLWDPETTIREFNFDKNDYVVDRLQTLSPTPDARGKPLSDDEAEFESATEAVEEGDIDVIKQKSVSIEPRRSQRSNKGERQTLRYEDEQCQERDREIQRKHNKKEKKDLSTASIPSESEAFIRAALLNR